MTLSHSVIPSLRMRNHPTWAPDLSSYPPRAVTVERTKRNTEISGNNNFASKILRKMETSMSLNALVRLPLSNSRIHDDALIKHSLFSSRTVPKPQQHRQRHILVVEAKGKKGMMARQYQRPPPPPLPKIEDDGNPRFVVFIRMANVCSLQLTKPSLLFFFLLLISW